MQLNRPHSYCWNENQGADVSVDIEDVKLITFAKKWKAKNGFFIGSILGAVSGAGFAAYMQANPIFGSNDIQVGGIVGFALISGLVGGVLGILIAGLFPKGKNIQLEGKSNREIQWFFKELRKQARVKNAQ